MVGARGLGAADQMALRPAALRAGRRRLLRCTQARAVIRQSRCCAARAALRLRPCCHVAIAMVDLRVIAKSRVAGLDGQRRTAGAGPAHGPRGQGGATVARSWRAAVAAVGG